MAERAGLTLQRTPEACNGAGAFRGFESHHLRDQTEPVAAGNSGQLLDHNPGCVLIRTTPARIGEGIVAIRSPTSPCSRDAEDDLSLEDIPNRKASRCSSR